MQVGAARGVEIADRVAEDEAALRHVHVDPGVALPESRLPAILRRAEPTAVMPLAAGRLAFPSVRRFRVAHRTEPPGSGEASKGSWKAMPSPTPGANGASEPSLSSTRMPLPREGLPSRFWRTCTPR